MEYLQRYGENVPVSAETTIASKTTYTTSTVSSGATDNKNSSSNTAAVSTVSTGASVPTTPTSKVSASGVYAAVACHEPHDDLAPAVSSSPLSLPIGSHTTATTTTAAAEAAVESS